MEKYIYDRYTAKGGSTMFVFDMVSLMILSRLWIPILVPSQCIVMKKTQFEFDCLIFSSIFQNDIKNGEWLPSNFRPNTPNFRFF